VPPRIKKSRDDAADSADHYRADATAADFGSAGNGAAGYSGNGSMRAGAGGGVPELDAGQPADEAPPAAPQRSGRMLRNWRVRSRLVLLIAIPTATAVALGGASIFSSWQSAVADQRTEVLASLSTNVTQLAYQIEAERDSIVWYIAAGEQGRAGYLAGHQSKANKAGSLNQLQLVNQQITYSTPWVKTVETGIAQIGSGYPSVVQLDAHAVTAQLETLANLRNQSLNHQVAASNVISEYGSLINTLLEFDDQVALSSSDPELTSTARALATISRYENEDSVQRGIVMYGLTSGSLNTNLLGQLTASLANQQADSTEFQGFATTSQVSVFNSLLAASLEDRVTSDEQDVTSNSTTLGSLPIVNTDWWGAMSDAISATHTFEEFLASSAVDRAKDLRQHAIVSALIVGGIILLVLVLSLLFTVFVGRSMVRPLRRLRAGALEVAGVRLPETVRRMNEADGENVSVDVVPIDVDSSDEIGEVARAFDQVHREALRLAATEAALRGNVNAMFVNLSRRSQSLVERQIRLIDELEQGEQDSERLGSLFQMDHLATRMRRNSENLLVLAGHESSRRWNQPVPLVDVLRAAISEIEQYERVMLNVQPGIAIRGPAVNDVVHLIAELAENATSFSSADTPVGVSGHLLGSGGVLLDITDEGVGMGGDEMAHANWRLDNPPVVDVAVSRRMGLFVVARLAARHGIRVRLRPASGNGLTALVWLPDEVIVHDGVVTTMDPGRLPERPPRVAIEPPVVSGGSGGWTEPSPPSAFDEVAAARARFSPLQPDSDDFGRAGGIGPPEISQPGVVRPDFARADFGNGDFGNGDFGNGDPGSPGAGRADLSGVGLGNGQFGGQGSSSPGLGGPGFGDRTTSEREFVNPDFGRSERPAAETSFDLGPQRVPGAGPHPGRVTTGPIPAIDTGPRPVTDQPNWFADRRPEADGSGTGPMPIVNDQSQPWSGQPDRAVNGGWAAGGDPAQAPAAGWQGQPQQAWSDHQSTQERPVWRDGQSDQYAQPVYGAPVARTAPVSNSFRSLDPQFGTVAGGVIVPAPASLGEENRLPIFEAVESDWFRRGRPSVDWSAGPGGQQEQEPNRAWSTPADDGWRAAEVAVAPASGGTTVAGLPRRVPQANLIPGAATGAEAPPPAPARSAAATRERFASLQRGMREGRAATGIDRAGEVPGDG
jgi:signal transduction histidine kinase